MLPLVFLLLLLSRLLHCYSCCRMCVRFADSAGHVRRVSCSASSSHVSCSSAVAHSSSVLHTDMPAVAVQGWHPA
jgi:hypothetical protein